MRNILTILNRELKAYFNSAIAYIFLVVFLLVAVGLFMAQFFIVSRADMRWFFAILPFVLSIFLPAVTMRLWSEDRKGNTLELLLTFPAKTYELVLGKFLAGYAFYCIALSSTVVLPVMISILGKPDAGALACGYLGALLLGGFFLALGILISGFCRDQIVAFILSAAACFGLFFIGVDFTVASIDGWLPGFGSFLSRALGVIPRLDGFQKGIIDVKDLLYFAVGTSLFLILNALWLETRLKPKSKAAFSAAAGLSFVIFVSANILLADMQIGRFDCSDGKLYTVSPVTASILKGLKAPVTAKLFISPQEKMPSEFRMLERNVRDTLDELAIASRGTFRYKVFHMEALSETGEAVQALEQSAAKKGIRPFQVRSIEADEMGVKLIYAAISVAYKERPEEVIPQVIPETLPELEYSLLSAVYRMTLKKVPEVVLVAPYEVKIVDEKVRALLQSLGQVNTESIKDDQYEAAQIILESSGYKVTRVRLSEEEPIPEGAGTLVLLEPRELSDRQRFEIGRFLSGGGSVLLAVQHYEFNYLNGPEGFSVSSIDKKPDVNGLLGAWGLGISDDFFMDQQADVVNVTGEKLFGIIPVSAPVKLPLQAKIIPEQMNLDLSITSRLPTLLYLWGTALKIDTAKLSALGLKSETLFTSSRDGREVKYHEGGLSNEDLALPPEEKRAVLPLAALVTGFFTDPFKGKETPPWKKAEDGASADPAAAGAAGASDAKPLVSGKGKLILTGCSRFFTNELIGKGGHAGLFLNSVDALSLGDDIIKVRSKQPADRSLRQLPVRTKAFWKIFTTIAMPLMICIAGALRLFARRRVKWSYLKSIGEAEAR